MEVKLILRMRKNVSDSGERRIVPCSLNFGIGWKRVDSFTPLTALSSGKSSWKPYCPSQMNITLNHTPVLLYCEIYVSADLLLPPHIHFADSEKIK